MNPRVALLLLVALAAPTLAAGNDDHCAAPYAVTQGNAVVGGAPDTKTATDPTTGRSAPPFDLPVETSIGRDRRTLRNSLVISGAYAGAFAIMWHLPEETTNWEKEEMWSRFLDGFRRGPVWDDDEWATNWILHPWWGMWVYQTERNHGEGMLRSFLVATAHSVFFEYFVEAWTERPSTQDLLSTSPLGALFGELVHRWIRRMGSDGFSRGERLLIDLLNPAYRWQIGFDRPVR